MKEFHAAITCGDVTRGFVTVRAVTGSAAERGLLMEVTQKREAAVVVAVLLFEGISSQR